MAVQPSICPQLILLHAPANREVWTCEPSCHPFFPSYSLISSLSSLRLMKLHWRKNTLMFGHFWNAHTKIAHAQTPAQKKNETHFCSISVLREQCYQFIMWNGVKEWNRRCCHSLARALMKTLKVWWNACGFFLARNRRSWSESQLC